MTPKLSGHIMYVYECVQNKHLLVASSYAKYINVSEKLIIVFLAKLREMFTSGQDQVFSLVIKNCLSSKYFMKAGA